MSGAPPPSHVEDVPEHVATLRAEHEVAALTAQFKASLDASKETHGVSPRPANAVRRTRANSTLPSRHKVLRDEAALREAEHAARLEELNNGALEREVEAGAAPEGSVLENARLADAVEAVEANLRAFRERTKSKGEGDRPGSSTLSIQDRIKAGVPTGRKRSFSTPSRSVHGRNITPVSTNVMDKIKMANAVDSVTEATEAFRRQLMEMRRAGEQAAASGPTDDDDYEYDSEE